MVMKNTFVLACLLSVMTFLCVSVSQAQNTETPSAEQGDQISKLLAVINNMTEEEKAFVRTNLMVEPIAYSNEHQYPPSYIIDPNPAPDTQTANECAGCCSAYLLRFYGEDVDGVWLYQQPSFPCKMADGAYTRCFKVLFEEQLKNYTTTYYTGTTDDLKDAVSQGVPVIVLLFTGKTLHYVPVVGYDESHFYIQDSVKKYRNVADNKAYNEAIAIDTFEKMWNIPLESCQRLFVIVKKQ